MSNDTHASSAATRRPARTEDIGRGPIDVLLLATTATLVLIGLISVYAGSAFKAETGTYFVRQQIQGAVLGLVVMAVAMRFNYRHYFRLIVPIFVGSLVLLSLTRVPGLGVKINGAQRWLSLGPLTFQPAEIVKLAVVFFGRRVGHPAFESHATDRAGTGCILDNFRVHWTSVFTA